MPTRPPGKKHAPEPSLDRVIGWREWIALPDLGVAAIKAKIDTGARSSSLHAFEVEPFRRRGKEMIRFAIHPIQRDALTEIWTEAELLEYRSVRSSNGHAAQRPVVLTSVAWAGEQWPIELTLANRDLMGFRMLLGREAVRHRWLVDAGRSFCGGVPRLKPSKKRK